ncbi:MAG: RluA family pseudouridine synthase [Ruminococcus sp.]|jgi:23S rRNA pseudouridine1911/1915/1917 synthase|nr:RluA family pseudouridine synthase [Ruminococcus sp.]
MTDNFYEFTADAADNGLRLDKAVTKFRPEISRSQAVKLLDSGHITVNGKINPDKKYPLHENDIITIEIPEEKPLETLPQDIPLDIVFEDDDIIVVNKKKGMVVHPAPGNPDGTLVNALLYASKLSGINGVIRPGIVHRLDKNTSGLLVVAKTDTAHKALSEMIKKHDFNREYLCVCIGGFRESEGVIEAPIGRNPHDRKKMCVIKDSHFTSRDAKTEYTVLDSHDGFSFLRIKLYTGRTHQIRVHLSSIGHPVFGDDVYGKPDKRCDGQCLHAAKLGFCHPVSGEYIEFEAELPDYFKNVLEKLKLSQ